jgi:hypothetical protein
VLHAVARLQRIGKCKGQLHTITGHKGPNGGWRYSSTVFLTTALCRVGWSMPRLCRFTHGKGTRYPSYRRPGGPLGLLGRVLKISPPPEFDPWTVQPVASRYSDCALLALLRELMERLIKLGLLSDLCLREWEERIKVVARNYRTTAAHIYRTQCTGFVSE